MVTYKQDVKEKSRLEIWTKAVKKLTVDRENQRILKPNYIRRLWDYSFDEILTGYKPNEYFIDSWTDFSNNLYESRQPQHLKVAYFCGPEPENDLEIMIKLGIKIENVWAIESDKKTYMTALSNVKKKYPTLKIFNGVMSELMKVTSFKFDIIYLDFTAPLFSKESKPILTINSVFENHSLSNLGILVINSSLPDKTDENVEFLSSYFRSHPFLESSIYSGDDKDSSFWEGADAYGYTDKRPLEESEEFEDCKIFEELISDNFESAYGAFSTHYPTIVSGYIQPMWTVANSSALKRMFLNTDVSQIKASIAKMSTAKEYDSDCTEDWFDKEYFEELDHSGAEVFESHEEYFEGLDHSGEEVFESHEEYFEGLDYSGAEVFESHEDFPIWNFILRLKESNSSLGKYWCEQFTKKNRDLSYFDSVQLYDLLRIAKYSYKQILSESLSDTIQEITASLPDRSGGVFCDVPLPHLWIELALNHLGNAYHVNTDEHWRAKYQAKERKMYLDMFVFDNCRALYDWLPMINLYGKDMASIERQIIIRSCMDAITKQNNYSSFYSYYGANLIGSNSKRWSNFGQLKDRYDLNA